MLYFVCAFKYVNIKTRFELENKLKDKKKEKKKEITNSYLRFGLPSSSLGPLFSHSASAQQSNAGPLSFIQQAHPRRDLVTATRGASPSATPPSVRYNGGVLAWDRRREMMRCVRWSDHGRSRLEVSIPFWWGDLSRVDGIEWFRLDHITLNRRR